MKRFLYLAAWFGLSAPLLASCSTEDPKDFLDQADEGVGAVAQGLSKCAGGKVGQSNYCSAACPCNDGEGDCDGAPDCINGSCAGKGIYFYGVASNACAPAHCANGITDFDETQPDCGGSCGTLCPNQCLSVPPNCNAGHCTPACPCPINQGDCSNTGAACTSGFCKVDAGASFGCGAAVDICLPATCNNGIKDGTETGVDCGGGGCTACVAGDTQSARFGGTSRDHGLDMVYDNLGNYIVVGRYNGSATFGGATFTSAGLSDMYVAKYNSLGVHQWSKSFGGVGPDVDLDMDVGVDSARNVVIAGNFWNTVDFGGGPLTSAGTTDAFVVKLDQNGNHVWSRRYGGPGADRINAVAVLAAGTINLAGSFQDTVSFGNITLTSAGNYDALLLRIASTGTVQTAKRWGSTDLDHAQAINVDSASNIYIGGSFAGTVDFGLGNVVSSEASVDGFALKVSTVGATLWAKSFGGTATDTVLGVAVDTLRQPTFVGRYRSTANFGGGNVTATGSASDVFAVALDTNGTYRWSKNWGGAGEDHAYDAAADAGNNVLVVGDFVGTANPGAGNLTSGAGTPAAFLVKYTATGTPVLQAAYGTAGVAGALGVSTFTGRVAFTGVFSGTADFGSGGLTSLGQTDMFWAKLNN